jgi:hypothetical protein
MTDQKTKLTEKAADTLRVRRVAVFTSLTPKTKPA